jgi:hypothetical protein
LVLLWGATSLAEFAPPAAAVYDAAALIWLSQVDRPQDALRLAWKTPSGDPTRAIVEVAGVDPAALRRLARGTVTVEHWSSFFSVRVAPAGTRGQQSQPPLWGAYRVRGDILEFEPRFPLEPGMKYRAELDPAGLWSVIAALSPPDADVARASQSTTKLYAEYSPPRRPVRDATFVTHVYPSSDRLPENLLRFYISFSGPMSRGDAYRHIKLVDVSAGKPIDAAFLELDEELWTNDGRRFTLLLDPGRVKRGLKPREELGPVLAAGKSYSLVIDREWPDAAGNPLRLTFQKPFRAIPQDDGSPDPKRWKIRVPGPGSNEALMVRFGEPLDRALLDRLMQVQDAKGQVVVGESAVGRGEEVWMFTPRHYWSTGDYRLVVGTELEDVAGNSIARPFEVDVAQSISRHVTVQTVSLPFQVVAKQR